MESKYPKFSDFADEEELLDGPKMRISEVLDREILAIGYKIAESKYKQSSNSKCLTLQFELEKEKQDMVDKWENGVKRIVAEFKQDYLSNAKEEVI